MDAAPVTPLVCCDGCARRITLAMPETVIAGLTYCADCAAYIETVFEAACFAVTVRRWPMAVAA